MLSFKNQIKLGLAITATVLLVVVVFAVGYRVGSDTQAKDTGEPAGQTTASQLYPTPTTVPTASPTIEPSPTSNTTENAQPIDTPSPLPSPSPEMDKTPTPDNEPALTDAEALKLLGEVWDIIDREFYGELPPPEERAYGAIRGMLETLDDDYTSFSVPSFAEIRREDASGTYEGIGAVVRMNEENILEIVQLLVGSPAESVGLLPGDLVLAVDGQSIVGYGIIDAITLIRGPEGTEVVLSIQRGDSDPFNVNIVRARLDLPIIESELIEDDIGYVSLFEFSSPATQRLETAIEELMDQGATALILDLRGNPGGFLDQAVQVSDLFLSEGLVLIERRSDGQENQFTSSNEGLAQDIPLVVLVSGGSASASEIVAGAIQDRGRGILIGEPTFGKGSVQFLHELSDGSELRVTIARWFTPNDRAIHGEGLQPDIEVPFTPEDQEAGNDPQLERAIQYIRTGQ